MTRRFWLQTLTALALVAVASNVSLKAELTEELHKTYPIAADGRVSLKNVNGAVHISAWDRNEVQVDAVKRARTKDALDEAAIVIDASTGSISIRTRYPEHDRRRDPSSVEYTLKVPKRARLFAIETVNGSVDVVGVSGEAKISSVNGAVKAKNLAGDTQLTTVNGQVQASFDRLDGAPAITINTVNGAIELSLPSKISAEFDAHTVHGRITNDFGIPSSKGFRVGGSLSGKIGAGAPARVRLNTVNGGIRILSMMDGRRVLNT